jgi:hypothetical protein
MAAPQYNSYQGGYGQGNPYDNQGGAPPQYGQQSYGQQTYGQGYGMHSPPAVLHLEDVERG